MPLLGSSIRRRNGYSLLLLFLAGGLVAPSMHRVHHAHVIAHLSAAAKACTHSEGTDDPHSHALPDLTDDPCWLNARDQLTCEPIHTLSTPFRKESRFAALPVAFSDHEPVVPTPIRGPPSNS